MSDLFLHFRVHKLARVQSILGEGKVPEWSGKLSKRCHGLVAVSLETAEDLLIFSDIGPALFLRLTGIYLLAILIKVEAGGIGAVASCVGVGWHLSSSCPPLLIHHSGSLLLCIKVTQGELINPCTPAR